MRRLRSVFIVKQVKLFILMYHQKNKQFYFLYIHFVRPSLLLYNEVFSSCPIMTKTVVIIKYTFTKQLEIPASITRAAFC